MSNGTVPYRYHTFDGEWHEVEAEVIEEGFVTLLVNGRELATLMCSSHDPTQLALGFLTNEGFISGIAEVEVTHVCNASDCADICRPLSVGYAAPENHRLRLWRRADLHRSRRSSGATSN
jgi:formate dehydrogenase assembly factor FdhD